MNAQSILTRIEQNARETAAGLLRDAQARAQQARRESEGRIEKGREEALERARQEARALDDRMQRMSVLDARKDLLAAKRQVLDEAFSAALDKLAAMPEDTARAFGLNLLLGVATGGERVIADAACAWCDQAFISAANEALRRAGKSAALTLSPEKRNLGGGFVLEKDGMEINCSYPAALAGRRMDLEAEVAALLFEQEA